MRKLPQLIDPFELSKNGSASFSGSLPLTVFPRLANLLVSTQAEVAVQLTLGRDEADKPFIRIGLSTQLQLTCQRCGEPVSCDINVEPKISPVLTDAEAVSVQKTSDPWVTNGEPIVLVDLVEDELLLSLPMVAKHENCSVETYST